MENVPGSSCAGYTANSWQWAGGPENGGVVNGMFCNGGTNLFTGIINFQSGGSVGMGTTTPAAALHIKPTSDLVVLELQNTYASSYTHMQFAGTGKSFNVGVGNASEATYSVPNKFYIFDGSSSAMRLVIDSSGNVGIGTASPAAKLHVVGDIQYTGLLKDLSDRRAKSDIRPLPGQLRKLMKLQPVSFVMNSDPQHRTELGLIAQDVEPIYPELVETGTDGMKSMSYVSLAAPMIEGMQEQQAEINQLRAMLAVVLCAALLPTFLLWKNRKVIMPIGEIQPKRRICLFR